MATNAVWLKLDRKNLADVLQQARGQLSSAEGELVLDFSSIRRIDASALRALEELAAEANAKAVNIVLRGVNVDIYKVLKLTRLAPRFSFLT